MSERDNRLYSRSGQACDENLTVSFQWEEKTQDGHKDKPNSTVSTGHEGTSNPSFGKSLACNAPIGVFDSGAGGLTVVRQIRTLLPDENILYFGDTGRVPYGPRPQSQVREFSVQIADFLRNEGAKAIIIACNTATAAALEAVQESFPGPVVGVIRPGAESAFAEAGAEGKVGLIATQGTVTSGVYDKELAGLGYVASLVKQACPDFVTLVESGLKDQSAIEDAAARYMQVFHNSPVDVLILGCTHFPMLSEYIKKELPEVILVDPAIQTVRVMKEMLQENGLLATPGTNPEYRFFCSGDPSSFAKSVDLILGVGDYTVQHVLL